MKNFIVGFLIAVVLIAGIPLAALGLIPGLSPLLGAGPKDLGIRFTPEQSKAAREKVGTVIVSLPAGTDPKDDFRLEGKKSADFSMDSTELTAHSNNRPWKNYPVRNLQIKIHDDGTIESSAVLVISKAMPYAMALGYSESQIRDAMRKNNIPPFEVPIYVLGKGAVANDQVTVHAQTIKIGAVPIPADIVSRASAEAEQVIEDVIRKHNAAFHADSVTFSGGKMHFIGQIAEKEYVITE